MRFRPGLWPSLMVAVALPVLLGLGTWQVQRLHGKTALIDLLATRQALAPTALPPTDELAPDWAFRRVRVRGQLQPEPALRFGALALAGVPGHRVLQRATLDDGRALVVDRGWRADREPAPLATPATPTDLVGALRWLDDARPSWFTPANDPGGNRWYRYDHGAFEAVLGGPLLPVVLQLTEGPVGPGTPVPQAVVVDLPNPHLGYAVTWYGLAASLVVVYAVYGWRRERSGS